jgi:glycosyltransferase involved in cell wall biosynthesis
MAGSRQPRITVIIPCYQDGRLVTEAVHSIEEPEPVELVVVDDASADEETARALVDLEAEGIRVLRHPRNVGVADARMTGLTSTTAPLVVPLDADDLAEPGALTAMADALDAAPDAAACVGDYVEFGEGAVMRAVPDRLDPFRIAYTNEYPITGVFRRSALEAVGGWTRRGLIGYEDWGLWMSLAEHSASIVHLGPGRCSYRRRIHGTRLNAIARRAHAEKYRALRAAHPLLFDRLGDHRRHTDLSAVRRMLYPLVYGERPAVPFERRLKPLADRIGVLTLTRRGGSTERDR